MAGTITVGNTKFTFDEDLYALAYGEQPDLVRNAMVASGAMAEDALIASLIENGGNQFTVPFYNAMPDDEELNYDGQTDLTTSEVTGSSQSGVVFGRMKGWEAPQFVADFTTANPMAAIAARVAKYDQTKTNKRLIAITDAVLGVAAMKDHTVTKTALTENTLSDATQEVFGDAKDSIAFAIMHSAVAQEFEDLNRSKFLSFTDENGMTRTIQLLNVNGIQTLIDDSVPFINSEGKNLYSTYLFGAGAIRHASAPVEHPVELTRDPARKGGVDILYTRKREVIHPNGFSFKLTAAMGASPTDAHLGSKANWSLAYEDHKAIPFMKLVSPGHTA